MKRAATIVGAALASAFGLSASQAGVIDAYTPVLTGGTLIDFEGFTDGTIISNQYPGVVFSQTPSGSPQIDDYPWLYGYGSSSGSGVLTGSTEGDQPYPTIAGIIATFSKPESAVQIFLSDTSPLGNYPITIYGAGDSVLASFVVPQDGITPPGYDGGAFPPPGTNPLPGIFVGYEGPGIYGIQVGPSTTAYDAFAVDDLRFSSGVPEPATWAMMLIGFTGLGFLGYNQSKKRLGPATA